MDYRLRKLGKGRWRAETPREHLSFRWNHGDHRIEVWRPGRQIDSLTVGNALHKGSTDEFDVVREIRSYLRKYLTALATAVGKSE